MVTEIIEEFFYLPWTCRAWRPVRVGRGARDVSGDLPWTCRAILEPIAEDGFAT
jgi:hypothetical protein